MKEILKKNFKTLYLCALIPVVADGVRQYFLGKQSRSLNQTAIFLLIFLISVVINTGWLWFVLKLSRNDEKPFDGYKNAFKSSIWIIILYALKYMILILIIAFVGLVINFLSVMIKNPIVIECIQILFIYFAITLFAFSEFIYYDNKKRGPLLAVLDSMTTIQDMMFKVFVLLIPIAVSDLFSLVLIANVNYKLILVIKFIWLFIFYPIVTLGLAILYNTVRVKKQEINDSLIDVAKSIDNKSQ